MKPDEQNRSRGKPLVSFGNAAGRFSIEPIDPISSKEMKLPVVKYGMKRHARAFTLIELLVVIAIIGILAAMLLPVLSHAKNSASKVTDINNLRQIMIAVHTFAADNEDALPQPNWDGGAAGSPKGWLYEVDSSATGTNRFKVNTGCSGGRCKFRKSISVRWTPSPTNAVFGERGDGHGTSAADFQLRDERRGRRFRRD